MSERALDNPARKTQAQPFVMAPPTRLNPRNDLVFKTLFIRFPELFRHMLRAVVGNPVSRVTILNPQIPGEFLADKAVVLDIRALVERQGRANVEMQVGTSPRACLAARFLYYGARDYAAQLQRGENYHQLTPTVSIVWAAGPIIPRLLQLHEVFELRGRDTGLLYSDHLRFHLITLANLSNPSQAEGTPLHRWARFFAADSEQELLTLALEDPVMHSAKAALDQLAEDPELQRLADKREIDRKLYLYELDQTAKLAAAEAEAGREKERAGREKERAGREKERAGREKAEAGREKERAGRERARASLQRVAERQLERHFGSIPSWAVKALAVAPVEQLDEIIDRTFAETTGSLEEVIGAAEASQP